MPLPIKQYKHMFKDVKFLATTAQPSYKEVSHWIDLLEDPTGGTIKVWNGTGWEKISGEGDSDTELVIGDTTGTAFDGGRGKAVEDKLSEGFIINHYLDNNLSNGNEIVLTRIGVSGDNGEKYYAQDTIPSATTTKAGVMSANDKKNLDNVAGLYYIPYKTREEEWSQKIKDAAGNSRGVYIDCGPDRPWLGLSFKSKNVYGFAGGGIIMTPESEIDICVYDMPNLDNPDEKYEASIRLKTGGDGSKFLSDDGTYKAIEIPDISNLATKTELNAKVSIESYNADKATFALKNEIPTDAPSDGSTYGRNNGAWIKVEMPDVSGFITETDADGKYATPALVDSKVAALVNSAPATLDTLKELADALGNDANFSTTITTKLGEKVDKTTYESDKAGFATKTELANKLDTSTYNSDKAGFATNDDLATKQNTLVSGTNIKTINNQSLLGEGNIEIAAEDSSIYVFELSKYITDTMTGQRFTGTITNEDLNALTDAVINNKLILGKMTDDVIGGLIPLQLFNVSADLYLKCEFAHGPILLEINITTKAYQGYFYSETIEATDSPTVTISPLLDETIFISSSSSYTLNAINVESYMTRFRLHVQTSSQSVMLMVDGLNGVIGATFTGSRIALEANSQYEIDVENDIAVVAKVNKPQAS